MARSLPARIIGRLAKRLPAYTVLPAYDYVQNVVEHHLNDYIGKRNRADVRRIDIVGGYLGEEIPSMLRRYPNVAIRVFEASERYQGALESKFAGQNRVSIVRAAASDKPGTVTFHETNLRGSGSLLEVGSLAAEAYGTRQAEKFTVEAITIDSVTDDPEIDCLWIDVQGAELMVLKGAITTLSRTHSIFTEVSVSSDLYKGGVTLDELVGFLQPLGFRMTLIGLDKDNLTGNAFFVRDATFSGI